MRRMIRVLIAEDLDWMKQSIRKVLEQHPDINVVGKASNGSEAIEMTDGNTTDVLILNLDMSRLNGRYIIEALAKSKSQVNVLALSAFDDLFNVQIIYWVFPL